MFPASGPTNLNKFDFCGAIRWEEILVPANRFLLVHPKGIGPRDRSLHSFRRVFPSCVPAFTNACGYFGVIFQSD